MLRNKLKPNTMAMARKITRQLQRFNISVEAGDNEDPHLPEQEIDLIIVLGGDGTILRTARNYFGLDRPILGINMGTIGFLSSIEEHEFDAYLEKLVAGDYDLESRMMLETRLFTGDVLIASSFCLNEIVIRSRTAHMVKLKALTGEQLIGTYRGDGIIIATPTGSTAYSLSAGGPILDPFMEAIVLTPISPYYLHKRPIVISAHRKLVLVPITCMEALVSVDGENFSILREDHRIEIFKSDLQLKLVKLKEVDFFYRLLNKLGRSEEPDDGR